MEHSFQSSLKDIGQGFSRIIKGEIHLAISEAKHTVGKVVSQSMMIGIACVLALVSSIFLLAFLFSGLAELLDGRYWLSALIFTGVFGAAAAVIGLRAVNKLKVMDMKLPVTRASLKEQKESLPPSIHNVVQRVQTKLHKEPVPKLQPEAAMLDAKLEVASGHELLKSGTHGFSEMGKDIAEVGRNIARLNPELTANVIKVAPVAAMLVPGLTLGYLGSQKLKRKLAAGPGKVVYRSTDLH